MVVYLTPKSEEGQERKKGTIAIFGGGIAFMIVGLMFLVSAGAAGFIIGLIIIGVGIVIVVGGYQDRKRIEKLDRLKKWDTEGNTKK